MNRISLALVLSTAACLRGFAADSIVVFNEIHYHPATNETASEWVELHNQMTIDIDLSAWRIEGGVNYTFPEGTIIPGGGEILVAANPAALRASSGSTNVAGPFIGRLNNSGARLDLRDRNDRLMDRLDYLDSGKWPITPDGSGATLAKRNENEVSNTPENWTSSVRVDGTPGRPNFPEPAASQVRQLIPINALWRYEASGTDLGTAWRAPGFNDSSWSGRNNATLLAYWPLNGNANALFGTSGSLVGSVTATADRNAMADGALAFNAASQQYVSIAGGGGLNGASAGTIAFWVKWTGTQDPDCCGTFGAVLARQANGVFSDNVIALTTADPGTARLVWRQTDAGPGLITGTTIVGTSWRHVAVTFSSAGSTLYLDGVAQGTGVGASLHNNSAFALTLGAWAGDGAGFLNGSMDDVAVWDTPLTAAQIAQLAAGTKTPIQFGAPESAVYHAGDGHLGSNDELFRTTVPLGPTTHYFRNTFQFADDPALTELTLDLAVDDGAVFYLNGTEIYRRNMPAGAVNYSTLASRAADRATLITGITLPSANLLPGANVLAVEVHQAAVNDTGMVFGAGLNATVSTVPVTETRPLITLLEDWKFDTSNIDPGPGWRSSAYSDAAWSNGPAVFFAGSGNVAGQSSERATSVVATASSQYTADGRLAMRSVDGSGLVGNAHTITPGGTMWLNNGTIVAPNDLNPFITFDLGSVMALRSMKVWNYNEFLAGRPELLARGVSRADILTGNTTAALSTLITGQTFNQAPGTQTDFSQTIDLGGVSARFVRLDKLTNFPGADFRFVGLSEVQFFRDPSLRGTEMPLGPVTYYFRKTFEFSGDPATATLTLNAVVDDGAIFHLNGVEVRRQNMPPGAVSHSTLASAPIGQAAFTGPIAISAASLVRGANLLAVEVHQTASDTDALFGAELTATVIPQGAAVYATGDLVFNEVSAANAVPFQIELINRGAQSLAAGGYVIARAGHSSDAEYLLPAQTIAARGFLVLDQGTLGFGAAAGDKLFLYRPGKLAVADAVEVHARPRGRAPDGTGEFLTPAASTPGASNAFTFHPDVVINEIMYHGPPTLEPFATSPEQWVELFNRGSNAVNLTGWRLDEGIDFHFASNTMIPPGGYLVVAKDPTALRTSFPSSTIVGPFTNKLSATGERIVLRDAADNPANVVHFYDDGRWPKAADAGGASLELRDPRADGNAGESWAGSNESGRSGWRTYSYQAVAAASPVGPDGQWHEFVMGLLDRGEVLLDDIRVIETPSTTPTNLIQNGTFDTLGTNKWRFMGNHHGEVINDPDQPGNKVLRLVANGSTEHMSNHGETTFVGNRDVVNNREYLISFRAKWISGSRRFHTRLYFNRLARTTLLDAPALHGTPGWQNTAFTTNIGPTYAALRHDPPVPAPFAPVTVSVQAGDPDGVASMTLWWRADGGAWAGVPMTSGDPACATPAGQCYSGSIAGKPAGTVIQFYIEAKDGLGATSTFPAGGTNSRALYKVDDGLAASNGLHNFRLVALSADADQLHRTVNLMSNERIDCTLIYDEREIFYGIGLRLKGSEHSRTESLRLGFNVGFDSDHLFRGVHHSVALDRSESVFFGQREMLMHQTLNHCGGLPTKYHDLVQVMAPRLEHTGAAELQLARYTDVFLDDQYKDGSDGMVFEYELVYQLNSTDDGTPEGNKVPAADSVVGTSIRNLGADKEAYRWTMLVKNNEDRDDFSRIIPFCQTMELSGPAFTAGVTNVMDVDQWLRGVAVNVLSGMGDSYGGDGSQHNVQFYVRPEDGRVLFFPHDMDAFFSATRSIVPNNEVAKLLGVPAYARTYYCHLLDIMATTYNANYMTRWANLFGRLLPAQPFASHLSELVQRADNVAWQVSSAVPNVTFAITNGGGNNFATGNSLLTLAGTAGLNVKTIEVNGVRYPITWTTVTTWSLQIPLYAGTNLLAVQGLDLAGQRPASLLDTITVTNTGPGALLPVLINEWMADNAGPEGLADPADGAFQDWFELFNPNTSAVNLGGFFLTDNLSQPTKSPIPPGAIIPARGFLLVWADNQPLQYGAANNDLHAAFQLGANGEAIGLFSPAGVAQHAVVFGPQTQNVSQGLFPDGVTNAIYSLTNWTPRAANTLAGPLRLTAIVLDNGAVTLTWDAIPGRTYRVQYKEELSDPEWLPLGSAIPAVSATAMAVDVVPESAHRFYRVSIVY